MPQINLHISNQLDLLAAALAETMRRPLSSVFQTETVVVQSLATRSWLKLRLAECNGIFANCDFPFLAELIARCVDATGQSSKLAERPSLAMLTWRIDSALRHCAGKKDYAPVAHYLADGDALKRFALAGRIAHLFDQYRLYRPDVLIGWADPRNKRSGHEAWQSKLWLEVDGSLELDRVIANLRRNGFEQGMGAEFPERISIFAPTNLPPAYLDLLLQLGRVRDVHLFLLRPSTVYHGDALTPKQRAKFACNEPAGEAVNPLLASWGRSDAEMTDLLIEAEERLGLSSQDAQENFREVAPINILATLQHDFANGFNRGATGGEPPFAVELGDDSLTLHVCHSPMREVEVLHDQLLACFERYPDLRPRDILVMTPEIEKYAPLIRAVFGYPEDENHRIPYTIADRHPRSESRAIDTFLTLMGLVESRYPAPEIFALLGSHALRRRFALTEEDLALIRHWIEATKIRWGIDAQHRGALGVPAIEANTWRHGLRRLLLGFAMPGDGQRLVAGILPQDDVEGDAAATLGRFLTATEALFDIAVALAAPRPLADWAEPLLQMLATFLEPGDDEDSRDLRHLRATIEGLQAMAMPGEMVEFKVVRHFLEAELGSMEQRGGFFKGGVTFCALKPVRSIPAEVVCLLGINDQVFPRRPQIAQFDLMADRRKGDPSPAADDRFSFLETLLSARRKLSISYVGRSAQDNKSIPPSVVVSELLDYAQQAFSFPANETAAEFLTVAHPLHAFSQHYFSSAQTDPRLFSYSEANASAARAIHSGESFALAPFIDSGLPESGLAERDIELGELIRFWINPAKYFLQNRLGLELPKTEESLQSEEPFELNSLEGYPMKQELLLDELGFAAGASPAVFAARGTLPPGLMGELQLGSIRAKVERFSETVQRHLAAGKKDEPREIKLVWDDFTLSGRIQSLYGGSAHHFRCAKLKPADRLRAWIEHLALCAVAGDGRSRTTVIGTDGVVLFNHVENARELLADLCLRFRAGQNKPLPFFPASALDYVAAEQNGSKDPLGKARGIWTGNYQKRGEHEDVFFSCCFNAADPLDECFIEVARAVCTPLLMNSETEEALE